MTRPKSLRQTTQELKQYGLENLTRAYDQAIQSEDMKYIDQITDIIERLYQGVIDGRKLLFSAEKKEDV